MTKPEIINIFTCEDKGKPMIPLEYVEALAGKGLAGDRYALDKGSYSKNYPKKRQVSFVAIEAIIETDFLPEETRRNIITKDIDLNSLVGKTFQIGVVVLKGTELCDPCKRPSVLANKKGFKEVFENKGGLRAEVIKGGMITIGEVTLKIFD